MKILITQTSYVVCSLGHFLDEGDEFVRSRRLCRQLLQLGELAGGEVLQVAHRHDLHGLRLQVRDVGLGDSGDLVCNSILSKKCPKI